MIRFRNTDGWVYFGGWVMHNCYISPNIPIDRFKAKVDFIVNIASTERKQVVFLGDLNAKSPLYEGSKGNGRGIWKNS